MRNDRTVECFRELRRHGMGPDNFMVHDKGREIAKRHLQCQDHVKNYRDLSYARRAGEFKGLTDKVRPRQLNVDWPSPEFKLAVFGLREEIGRERMKWLRSDRCKQVAEQWGMDAGELAYFVVRMGKARA